MFTRTLVAMAFSPATEALVSAIPDLKEFGTREIALVHVTKPMGYPVSLAIGEMGDLRQRLRSLAERLEKADFEVTIDVRSGSPAAEIVRVADERSPDVIMVGSRSHTRIGEAFIGSVAWEVVRRARRPVLLQRIEPIRPDPEAALESRGSGLPDHVIYATDFSETAERALPWLRDLAQLGVPSFTLLHSVAVDDVAARNVAAGRFDQLEAELTGLGASSVSREVREMPASEMVLSLGGRSPAAMVVMGTHGRGFLPEIVLGSESRRVVRSAAARVLLIPALGVEAEAGSAERSEVGGEEISSPAGA
jgi:nucleotide-binding universal stress UspA family protein